MPETLTQSARYHAALAMARELRREGRRLMGLARDNLKLARELADAEMNDLMGGIAPRKQLDIDPNLIIGAVGRAYRIDRERMLSRTRTQHVAFARQVAMHLVRHMLDISYPQIADYFGRDHSTVIHADQLIAARRAGSPAFALELERIEHEIRALRMPELKHPAEEIAA
jgi:chromosomal replication initiator protein